MNQLLPHLRRIAQAEVSDAELLRAFLANRDEGAFTTLVRRHGPMVLAVCQRVLRDRQDAEDACQATFLVLVSKAHSIRRPEHLGSWLYSVAYRTALGSRRSRRQLAEHELVSRVQEEPIAELVWQELRLLLDEELQRLPLKYRLPIVLCYLEGKSNRATAQQLGWSVGTVVTRLAKARQLLRQQLAHRGLVLSVGVVSAALSQGMAAGAIPALLVTSTVQAALVFQAGRALAGVLSVKVIALMEGTVQAMLWTKVKLTTVVILVAVGAGIVAYQASAQGQAKREQPEQETQAVLRGKVQQMEAERAALQARVQQLEAQANLARNPLTPEQEQALKDLQTALTRLRMSFQADPTRKQAVQSFTDNVHQQLLEAFRTPHLSAEYKPEIEFYQLPTLMGGRTEPGTRPAGMSNALGLPGEGSESKPGSDRFQASAPSGTKPDPVLASQLKAKGSDQAQMSRADVVPKAIDAGQASLANAVAKAIEAGQAKRKPADATVVKAITEDGLVLIEVGENTVLKPGQILETDRDFKWKNASIIVKILFQNERMVVAKLEYTGQPSRSPVRP